MNQRLAFKTLNQYQASIITCHGDLSTEALPKVGSLKTKM
jgi:hypothetical protein